MVKAPTTSKPLNLLCKWEKSVNLLHSIFYCIFSPQLLTAPTQSPFTLFWPPSVTGGRGKRTPTPPPRGVHPAYM